ncbi:MAG: hypothetical protein M1829_004796 [Trizodia sp. TS-e1964]|nr:MAG: hypothetical protein M1829_004796 [Trizodia sp. TS-e1964]
MPSSINLETPSIPPTSRELREANNKWKNRLEPLLSSPSRPEFLSFTHGMAEVATTISLQSVKIGIYEQKRLNELTASSSMSRRSTKQHKTGLTLEEGIRLDQEKVNKREQDTIRRQQKHQDDLLYAEQRKYHQMGVKARKMEKLRIKQLSELRASGNPVSNNLYNPIIDPEISWNATYGEAFADLKQRNKRKKPNGSLTYHSQIPPNYSTIGRNNSVEPARFEGSTDSFDHSTDFQLFSYSNIPTDLTESENSDLEFE